jgi:hypothetical protein
LWFSSYSRRLRTPPANPEKNEMKNNSISNASPTLV